jgi:hypothetical protein
MIQCFEYLKRHNSDIVKNILKRGKKEEETME